MFLFLYVKCNSFLCKTISSSENWKINKTNISYILSFESSVGSVVRYWVCQDIAVHDLHTIMRRRGSSCFSLEIWDMMKTLFIGKKFKLILQEFILTCLINPYDAFTQKISRRIYVISKLLNSKYILSNHFVCFSVYRNHS